MNNDKVYSSRITIEQLRLLIREEFKLLKCQQSKYSGSIPDESYHQLLIDDPAYDKQSVIVPKDIKDKIKKWIIAMKLDGRK